MNQQIADIEKRLPHPKVNPRGVALLTTELLEQIGEFQADSWEELANIKEGLKYLTEMVEVEIHKLQMYEKGKES